MSDKCGLADDTVVKRVRSSAQKRSWYTMPKYSKMSFGCAVAALELWSFGKKKQKTLLTTRARDGGLLVD